MPDEEFRLRAGAYWIAQEFAQHLKFVRDQEPDPDAKAALERKWLVVFAASAVYRLLYDAKWQKKVRQLYKGDWTLETEGKGQEVLRVFKFAKTRVIQAYKTAKEHDRNFVHRNWMRSKDTPKKIYSALETGVIAVVNALE